VACFDCVELVDATVETIVKDGAAIGHVVLHDGTIIAGDKFIVANGAGAGELIARSNLGISIPGIFCSVGVSIQISAPDSPHTKAIRTPNRGLACGLYTVPFYTGPDRPLSDIIIGSSSFVSPTPHFEPRVGPIQSLLTGAMEQINSDFYRANVKCVNTGLRPLSADTYPVVGRSSINNLIIATATKRDGFHLAPVISETLAKLVHDEPIDAEWAYFAPERKLIRNLSREKAIDLGVRHMMSGSYQHGFVPSHDRLADRMKNMLKYELETLHDTVGAHEWGIPPELLDMYRYGHISAND
jgi:glycine/D-amino acid oxidase-like deaminating enzyme